MGAKQPHTAKPSPQTALGHIPEPNLGVDLRSLPLTAQEGYILSRIDGRTSPDVLCSLIGISSDVLATVLMRLHDLGAIRWRDASTSIVLQDDCDLTAEEQQRIQDAEDHVLVADYWSVLGVDADSSASAIKRAYFQASKAFHPDRYFGRKLGPYQARMAGLFNRIKEAYDVLSDTDTRAAYAAKVPPPAKRVAHAMPMLARMPGMALPQTPLDPAQHGGGIDAPVDAETARLNAHRDAIKKRLGDRVLAHTGNVDRIKESAALAQAHYQRAQEYLNANKLMEACNSLRLATTHAPRNAQYQHAYQEVLQRSVAVRAMRWNEQGDIAAAVKDADKAGMAYANASDLLPDDPHIARHAGRWLGTAGQWAKAIPYLQRACHGMPTDAAVAVALIEACIAAGRTDVARQSAQEALMRFPDQPTLRDMLQRLMEQPSS